MYVRVEEILGSDEWQSQHGTMVGWNLRVTDEHGNEDFISLNSKPNNVMTVGQEFEFTPNGQMFGSFKKGKREQKQGGGRPQNSPVNGQRATQSASSGGSQAKAVPTMSQAVAVLRECIEAVKDFGTDAHATTLFLARLRGDIRRDPTGAEIEQAKAEAARKAEEAAKEAERLAAEAAKQQALAGMGPAPGDDSDIPF